MAKILSCCIVLCLVAAALPAESPDGTPADLEGWKQRHSELGKTPEGALKLWFDAVFLCLDPARRELGRQVLQELSLPLRNDDTWYHRPSNRTFVTRLEDSSYHHIFRSYAKGTAPENGYAMDPGDYQLRIEGSQRDAHGRGWRLLLVSSGADNPRPVYLRQSDKTGLWYVDGYGNVYVGIRPPQEEGAETFH